MPARKRPPAYCLHRPTGQAFVRLDGRCIYLGRYNTSESRRRYQEELARWRSNEVAAESTPPAAMYLGELSVAWLDWIDREYSESLASKARSLLHHLCGDESPSWKFCPIDSFGAREAREFRDSLIERGLARTTINGYMRDLRAMLRWGVGEAYVSPHVLTAVSSLATLRRGRGSVRETARVQPVPLEVVEATIPFMPPAVAQMTRFQLLTGARPQEVRLMRFDQIVTDDHPSLWFYRPPHHKTAHHGRERLIVIGPKAQEILRRLPEAPMDLPMFLHRTKKGRVGAYSKDAYTRAIARACQRAIDAGKPVTHWHPNQLRHTRATELRRLYGMEVARATLGHARVSTTEIYAEIDAALAYPAALATG